MKTTTKKLSDTKVEVKVMLDATDLEQARAKTLKRLAADLKVQGFRKGKVPAEMVPKYVGENEINSEVIEDAVHATLPEAINQAKLMPITVERVNVDKYVPTESAEYHTVVEILPDIKLGDYKKLKAKMPDTEPSEAEVQEVFDSIISAYSEKTVVKRAAKNGDEVIIDFVGKKDSVAFKGGSAKDYPLHLGSGEFIPGFEEGIVGHASGDKFDLELTFPKDYGEKTLAGQKVVFEVLVKQVNEIKKPELNDELAQKCGNFQNIDELRADIKKNLGNQKRHQANEAYREALVAELVKNSKVSAPEILVKDQLRFIKDDMRRNAQAYGMQLEEYIERSGRAYDDWEAEARKVAEERVKSSLVLQVLAKEVNVVATPEEVEAKVNELRDLYKKSKEAIENLKKPEVHQDIRNRLIIDKTLDFLVEQNQPTPKEAAKKSTKTATKKTTK